MKSKFLLSNVQVVYDGDFDVSIFLNLKMSQTAIHAPTFVSKYRRPDLLTDIWFIFPQSPVGLRLSHTVMFLFDLDN